MEKLPLDLDGPDPRRGLSTMSRGLVGSEILRIAAEIRAAVTAGQKIANFTVGDFSSREFPIPDRLRDGTLKALAAGETNYPPSDGVLRLREAVREFWRDRLDLEAGLLEELAAKRSERFLSLLEEAAGGVPVAVPERRRAATEEQAALLVDDERARRRLRVGPDHEPAGAALGALTVVRNRLAAAWTTLPPVQDSHLRQQ